MRLLRVLPLVLLAGVAGTLPASALEVATSDSQMSLVQAAVLGVVEGLTEYLPVSSTGHLILAQRFMDIPESASSNAYAVCIQLGAIIAVLGLYFGRVRQMARGLVGRDPVGRALTLNICIAFAPAALVGLLFNAWIEERLYGLWPIIAAWAAGGAAILWISWTGKEKLPPGGTPLEGLALRSALFIGLFQCLAMWPGVSRSLVTIVAGVLVGLRLTSAVEFSFLLGVLTLGAATAYKLVQFGPEMLDDYGVGAMLVGFAAALVSAVAAVKWMVSYLSRHGLAIFGYYRIGIALAAAAFVLVG